MNHYLALLWLGFEPAYHPRRIIYPSPLRAAELYRYLKNKITLGFTSLIEHAYSIRLASTRPSYTLHFKSKAKVSPTRTLPWAGLKRVDLTQHPLSGGKSTERKSSENPNLFILWRIATLHLSVIAFDRGAVLLSYILALTAYPDQTLRLHKSTRLPYTWRLLTITLTLTENYRYLRSLRKSDKQRLCLMTFR